MSAEIARVVERIDRMVAKRKDIRDAAQHMGDLLWELGREGPVIDASDVWEQMQEAPVMAYEDHDQMSSAFSFAVVAYSSPSLPKRGLSVLPVTTFVAGDEQMPTWETPNISDWGEVAWVACVASETNWSSTIA